MGSARWTCSTALPGSRRDPMSPNGTARSAPISRASAASPMRSRTSTARERRCRTIAAVLYGEACLHETLGAPRIQNYVRVTTLPNGLVHSGRRVGGDAVAPRRRLAAPRARLAASGVSPRRACGSARADSAASMTRRSPLAEQVARRIPRSHDQILRASVCRRRAAVPRSQLPTRVTSYERAIDLFPDAQAARLGLGGGASRRWRYREARSQPCCRRSQDSRPPRRAMTRGGSTTTVTPRTSKRCSTSCARRSGARDDDSR